MCVVASGVHLTGDLASNPGMCPDWESNWQPFGSQACDQSTEPHQPGRQRDFLARVGGAFPQKTRSPFLTTSSSVPEFSPLVLQNHLDSGSQVGVISPLAR